jgi:hypothetical protein
VCFARGSIVRGYGLNRYADRGGSRCEAPAALACSSLHPPEDWSLRINRGGSHDSIFTPEGARHFLRDVPDAELHFIDTGHLALEDHQVRGQLERRVPNGRPITAGGTSPLDVTERRLDDALAFSVGRTCLRSQAPPIARAACTPAR